MMAVNPAALLELQTGFIYRAPDRIKTLVIRIFLLFVPSLWDIVLPFY